MFGDTKMVLVRMTEAQATEWYIEHCTQEQAELLWDSLIEYAKRKGWDIDRLLSDDDTDFQA